MILLALFAAASMAQASQAAGLLDATPETYQAPVVRPFEPPSDFGRETEAQGDVGGDWRRSPLTHPVVVEAYVGDYEVSPGDVQTAYDQGVAQAEIDADRRAGPLDGRWRVADADGKPLLSFALTDRGEGRRIEGAWRRLDAPGGVDCRWSGRSGRVRRRRRRGAAGGWRTASAGRRPRLERRIGAKRPRPRRDRRPARLGWRPLISHPICDE